MEPILDLGGWGSLLGFRENGLNRLYRMHRFTRLADFIPTVGIGQTSKTYQTLVKVCIHLYNGAKLRYIFSPNLSLEQSGNNHMIMHVKDAMVFTNWLSFKKSFTQNGAYEEITIDLSTTSLVDHTVMESLEELVEEEKAHGRKIHVQGLNDMKPVSSHPHSARKSTVMTVPDFAKRNK